MNLTQSRVTQERRPGRYADGMNGLYLVVSPTGGRWFQWRGTVHGRRRELGVGSATCTSLDDARDVARKYRRFARDGKDPAVERDRQRRQAISFEAAARRVHAEQIAGHCRNEKHVEQWLGSLERYVFPAIGALSVNVVSSGDLFNVLRPIWPTATSRRVLQRIRTVFNWAIAAGYRDGGSPADHLEKLLPRPRQLVKHFRALPYHDLPAFMHKLESSEGTSARALRFLILTATRTSEVRGARWNEIEWDTWVVPAERTKTGREHRVPLSEAALQMLDFDAHEGSTNYIFPGRVAGQPLSPTALIKCLDKYQLPITVHGFRSTFRDWCEECTDFPHAVKEQALGHAVKDKVERAYLRTDLIEKRAQLMQLWGEFCNGQQT